MTGCASSVHIADEAFKANEALDYAANQQLLLNIVRASHRMPMLFTKVNTVRLTAGGGVPGLQRLIVKDSVANNNNGSGTLSWTGATLPGLDVVPLDSQEFMQGITTPIGKELVNYYVQQGWPKILLLHLFVDSITYKEVVERKVGTVYEHEFKTHTVSNNPLDEAEMMRFQTVADRLARCKIVANREPTRYGPKVQSAAPGASSPGAAPPNPQMLAAAVAAGLSYEENDASTQYWFEAKARLTRFTLECSNDDAQASRVAAAMPADTKHIGREGVVAMAGSAGNLAEFVLSLRSPEAMLYYLGESVRYQRDKGGAPIQLKIGSTPDMLFCVRFDANPPASAIAIQHLGAAYSIQPGAKDDRTTHVLTLMSQLLQLQNKSTQPPATGVVTVR